MVGKDFSSSSSDKFGTHALVTCLTHTNKFGGVDDYLGCHGPHHAHFEEALLDASSSGKQKKERWEQAGRSPDGRRGES